MNRQYEVISYQEMTARLGGRRIQKGMNYRIGGKYSVFLMNTSGEGPYSDKIEMDGSIEYEGHDVQKTGTIPDPKVVDQPERNKDGTLTDNGKFFEAALRYKEGKTREAEVIQVYDKMKVDQWRVFGNYRLIDGRREKIGNRFVFKFILLPEHIEQISETKIEEALTKGEIHIVKEILVSEDKVLASVRKGQNVLRKHVLENYSNGCAMCEISDPYLLRASHIIPWSKDITKRGILENVICLCVLHDRLFENGTVTLNDKFEIEFSKVFLTRCNNSNTYAKIKEITFEKLKMPDILPYPDKELLSLHRQQFVTHI